MNYTDALLEFYISQAPTDKSEEQTAFKKFKDELSNGPAKSIRYANGVVGRKRFGTFDLQNFHISFDRQMKEAGIDLEVWFKEDGKLATRGLYSQIKTLDRSLPFTTYLYMLWGLQFGTSDLLGFTGETPIIARFTSADKEKLKKEIAEETIKQIYSLPEWKSLADVYAVDKERDLWIDMTIDFYNPRDLNAFSVKVYFENTISRSEAGSMVSIYLSLSEFQDTNTLIKDIANIISSDPKIKEKLNKLQSFAEAAFFLINNYKHWQNTSEAKDLQGAWSKLCIDYLVYKDPATNIYYKAEQKDTGDQPGLLLTNIEQPTQIADIFYPSFILVAARTDWSRSSGRCYRRSSWTDYYNSSILPEHIQKVLNIHTTEQPAGNGQLGVSISKPDGIFANHFDTRSTCRFELDSGD